MPYEGYAKDFFGKIELSSHLVLLTVDTIKSLIISPVYVTICKNPRVKFLHNSFMLWISCSDKLVITYV